MGLYNELKEFHPNAKIESNLERDLLNILGSPVHLSKTVMNLVNNTAEAMDDGGNIFITTESKYIDKPIRGYDTVKEGDYEPITSADAKSRPAARLHSAIGNIHPLTKGTQCSKY